MIVNSLPSSTSTSWEEKAFAEDISNIHSMDGSLGGCVWPPRSYSCAFCYREFRSAQALGGHMNIHRRDRAKLKQCLDSGNNTNSSPKSSTDNIFAHHHQNSPLKPLVIAQDNNLNSLDPNCYSCPSSYNKTQPTRSYFTSQLPYTSSRVSSHIPCSGEYLSIGVVLDLEKKTNPTEIEDYDLCNRILLDRDNDFIETESSPIRFCDEIIIDNKANRNWKRPELLFLMKPLQSAIDVHEVKPVASIDDLDLELRLGNAKVQ